jgi:hypothetical protein
LQCNTSAARIPAKIFSRRRGEPSAASRNQIMLGTGRLEWAGMTGSGMSGRGMGKKQSLDLFLCRTFLCRSSQKYVMPAKAIVRGMIVWGMGRSNFLFL